MRFGSGLVLWAWLVGAILTGCNRPEGTCIRGHHTLLFHFIQLGPITATYERDTYVCDVYQAREETGGHR